MHSSATKATRTGACLARWFFYVGSGLAIGLAACSGPRREPGPDEIALVNGEPVTVAQVRARYRQASPADRAKATSHGGRHFLLDLIVDDLLLQQEARKRGIRPSFSQLEPLHARLMKQLLEAEFESTVTPDQVSRAEIRAEYEHARPQLRQPAVAKIEVVYAKTRERALAILKMVKVAKAQSRRREFDRILREEADPQPEGHAFGHGGAFIEEDAARELGPEVARAVFSPLPEDSIVAEPVVFRGAFGVVIVLELHPEDLGPPFEELEREMRVRAYEKRREAALDRFVSGFRDRHEVVFHEENLSLVRVFLDPIPAGPSTGEVPASSSLAPPQEGAGPRAIDGGGG